MQGTGHGPRRRCSRRPSILRRQRPSKCFSYPGGAKVRQDSAEAAVGQRRHTFSGCDCRHRSESPGLCGHRHHRHLSSISRTNSIPANRIPTWRISLCARPDNAIHDERKTFRDWELFTACRQRHLRTIRGQVPFEVQCSGLGLGVRCRSKYSLPSGQHRVTARAATGGLAAKTSFATSRNRLHRNAEIKRTISAAFSRPSSATNSPAISRSSALVVFGRG
jgi:hypothetical protein